MRLMYRIPIAIAIISIFNLPLLMAQDKADEESTLMQGEIDGELSAQENYTPNGYFKRGFMKYSIFGFFAREESDEVVFPYSIIKMLEDKPEAYKYGFRTGYSKIVKKKRNSVYLRGVVTGLVSTVALYSIILSATGGA